MVPTFKGLHLTKDLRSVGPEGQSIAGLCPASDIMIEGEKHVWERHLTAFGLYTDPYEYESLLTVTDHQRQLIL